MRESRFKLGLKVVSVLDNEFFKKLIYEDRVEVVYDKYKIPIGIDTFNGKVFYLDVREAFRMLIVGMTRSGKTWLLRVINDRLKKAGYCSIFLPDVKNEFGSSNKPLQKKFRKYLLKDEVPAGTKVVPLRPTFFKTLRTKGKSPDNMWYSININKLTKADLLTLMPDKLTPNQKIIIETLYDEIDKIGGIKEIQQLIDMVEDIPDISASQISHMKYKFYPLKKGHLFEPEHCHDIIDAMKKGVTPAIVMEDFESISRTGAGFPQVFVSIVLREVTGARRRKEIPRLVVFVDEASRFVPADGDPSCKIEFMECLMKGTKVMTSNGCKNIENLNMLYDKVISYDFSKDKFLYSKFKHLGSKLKETHKVTLENGETVYCSKEHKFFKKNSADEGVQTLRLQDLKEEDKLLCKKEANIVFNKIVKIEEVGVKECFDIEVPIYSNFLLDNSIITHNSVDLDSRYGINYVFATQQVTKLPDEIFTQCRYIMIPQTADVNTFKHCFASAGMMKNIQSFGNQMVKIKKKLKQFDWVIIDRTTGSYTIIHPIAPLSFHEETTD